MLAGPFSSVDPFHPLHKLDLRRLYSNQTGEAVPKRQVWSLTLFPLMWLIETVSRIKTSLMTLPIPNTTPGFGMPLWSMTHWTHSSKSSREKFYPRSWEELSKVSMTTTLSKGFCQSPDIFKSWKNTSFEIEGGRKLQCFFFDDFSANLSKYLPKF